jgi:hypothetical protein
MRFLEGASDVGMAPSVEVNIYLSLEDKEWTKEETDYLFNLVRDFDLRWYIIHDRYEYPGEPLRTLEVYHTTSST